MKPAALKLGIVWLFAFFALGLLIDAWVPSRVFESHASAQETQALSASDEADSATAVNDGSAPLEPKSDANSLVTEPGTVGRFLEQNTPETGSPVIDTSIGRFFKSISQMIDGFIAALPNLIIASLLLLAVFFIAKFASSVVGKVARRARLRGSLVDLFMIFAKVGVWLVGLVTAAGIVFPEFGFSKIVTTAGLASVAVGFAFKDIFENFFAGILILWRFPFENGDFIEVDGLMGKVEHVEIRMTHLRQTNGELLLIPNGKVYKDPLRVITNEPLHRVEVAVGIAYGENVGEGRDVILNAVKSCDKVNTDTPPEVLLSGFGASSMDYDVIFWCNAKPLATRRCRDQVIEAIKNALDEAGIEIPYPYRTLTFTPNEPDIINAVAGNRSGAATEDGSGDTSA